MEKYSFEQLVDIALVKQLLESQYQISGMTYVLLDTNENILVSIGLQEICTRFHRSHPVSVSRCRESDTHIKTQLCNLSVEYPFLEYRCKNGLIEIAMPILIEGCHLATLFMGQFFYDDDPPDQVFFLAQAREFGFDPDDYLGTLKQVPILSREHVPTTIMFLHSMVRILADSGLKNFRLILEMEQRKMMYNEIRLIMAERNQAQAQLDRTLTILNCCRRTLMMAEDEQTLLNDICGIICDKAGYRFCWVGYSENNECGSVRPLAWAGAENGYLIEIIIPLNDSEQRRGPESIAVKYGKRILVQNVATAAHFFRWREKVLERGYRSVISLPLKDAVATPFGALTIFSSEMYAFSPDEVRLLDDLAEDVAFSISALRARFERNQLEKRLAVQEQQFRSLAENSPENITRYDRECRAVYINRHFFSPLPYPSELFLGKTPLEVSFNGNRAVEYSEIVNYEAAIRQALDEGVAGEVTLRISTPSGEQRTHSILITPERDGNDTITGALAFGRDVTEQLAAASQLWEIHQRLEAIFTTIPDLVWLKDVNGVFLACNPALERYYGAKEAEIIGKTDFDFVDAELAQFYRDRDAAAIRAGGVLTNEEWITYADNGDRVCVETSKTPLYDHDNRIIGVLGISRDITSRKEAERNVAVLSFALNNIQEAAILRDESTRIRYVNEGASRALGYSCSELLELGIPDIDPDFSMELCSRHWEKLTAGASSRFESRHRAKDGRIFPVEICANHFEYEGENYIFTLARDITERKRVEAVLKMSEERYRTNSNLLQSIFESSSDVIVFALNTSCTYLAFNARHREAIKAIWNREIAIGMNMLEIISNVDDRERTRQNFNRALSGESFILEECYGDESLSRECWQNYYSPIRSDAGDITGMTCFALNITERKRVEIILSESEERFRTLAEKSLVGVYIIQDSLFRYVNPAFEELAGYSSEELINTLGPVDLLTPEDCSRILDSICSRIVGEIEYAHQEFTIRRKNGSIRVVESFGSRAQHQGRCAVLGTIIDITERKKAEEKLFLITERWERTFDAVPDLIAIIDTDCRIVQVNKAMAERLGVTPEECVGLVCCQTIHNTDSPPPFCPQIRTARDCQVHTEEITEKRLGGVFIVTTSPIYDSTGKLTGCVHVARDITERRRAEDERRQLEAQLHQSQKMEAIGQLAGGIAHDFNNIMTAIIGFTEIVRMKLGNNSPHITCLDKILASAERAAGLTRDLLTFSRKQVTQLTLIDLGRTITGAQQLISRFLREDIELVMSCPDEPLTVMAGETQLTQIVMNLTTNARDAMPSGGKIAITISSIIMDKEFVARHGYGKEGMFALITFADTGCGMDETTQARIFEPFFTTKEVGQGTGLGLATVYGIVKQLGGFINVSSEPGKGTIFRIYLPSVGGAVATENTALVATLPHGGTETVLIAEDDPNVREIVESLLSDAGYKVISAKDGNEALSIFSNLMDSIDLLVLDVVMPGKSGIDVFQVAQKIHPEIKAVLMSGYTTEVMAVNDLMEEGVKFLQKPVNPRVFLRTVRDALDGE